LKEAFRRFGHGESVKIITDKVTCKSKGFAFSNCDHSGGRRAIAKRDGTVMDGRELKVSEASPGARDGRMRIGVTSTAVPRIIARYCSGGFLRGHGATHGPLL